MWTRTTRAGSNQTVQDKDIVIILCYFFLGCLELLVGHIGHKPNLMTTMER